MESQATNRLVIRIKLPAQAPAAPPARPPLSRLALSLVLVPVVVALGWWGISMFGSEPDSPAPSAPPVAATSEAAPAASHEPLPNPAAEVPDAPPSPINEVLPAVSRGALNTVRGTIRVTIRVTLDKSGAVLAATADEPGPSRYFERHSLEAARKWTFTPAKSDEQRTMLVRFYFKRSGVTARASSPQ
jgi:TonB family protein